MEKVHMEKQIYKSTGKSPILQITGLVLIAVSFLAFKGHEKSFMYSFLTSSLFWLTISLGALFFVFLHHLVSAKWSVVVRRFAENIAQLIPWMALFMIPVFYFGAQYLFKWADPQVIAHDHLVQKKLPYLNLNFFYIRSIVYFLVWSAWAVFIIRNSVKHDDTGDIKYLKRMKRFSAIGTFLFAVTFTFAAFDWVMSLDPHWYSTIFGIYVFAGSVVAVMAFMTLIVLYVHGKGYLNKILSFEHFHDLGKMLFAFTCFWAYIAFSQYVLIWYGNIPEETVWYAHRWVDSWKFASILLAVGHFVVPFIFLLPRPMKRNKTVLSVFCVWMLLMHLLDLAWLIYPNIYHHGYHFHWYDAVLMLGFALFFVGRVMKNISQNSLIPIHDPILQESIHIRS